MRYIDVTGKTEEEAVRKALEQLHLDRDDVSVEILERAKSGFLGIGSTPARVRVSYELDVADEPEVKAEPPRAEEKKLPAKPAAGADTCVNDDVRRITEFLSGLLEHMECTAEVQVYEEEKNRYKVILVGQKLGALIGRRGETLDAIQQLTNYAVNSGRDKRLRIHVDAENYRAKREQSLESLANKVAGKVLKYRRSVTLEPMNAYERHVIHAALQDKQGVTTYSIGTEPNRRVVVAYERGNR